MGKKELDRLRKARNKAFADFRRDPTFKTKERYKKAQSIYGCALKKTDLEDDRSWSIPVQHLPKEVDDARLAANAARRENYANPNPETKEALRLAQNEYLRIRLKLDPEYKAKVAAANAKKLELARKDPAIMAKRVEAIKRSKAKKKARLKATKKSVT